MGGADVVEHAADRLAAERDGRRPVGVGDRHRLEHTVLAFLDATRARTFAAVADRIFPADDGTPSASGLGAVEYLDGQLAGPWGQGERLFRQPPFRRPGDAGHGWQSPLTPAEAYGAGLDALDQLSSERAGAPFAELAPDDQDELLRSLERGEVERELAEGISARAFFELLKTSVQEGVFADPRHGGNRDFGGWRWVGFPEERAAYAVEADG
jgi:gluconate 2-dehydrogenase gamma chain